MQEKPVSIRFYGRRKDIAVKDSEQYGLSMSQNVNLESYRLRKYVPEERSHIGVGVVRPGTADDRDCR